MSLAPRPTSSPSSILRFERVARPAFAWRNHVEVAGKAEMRASLAACGDHVLGRAVGRLAEHPAVDGEAERLQDIAEHIENLATRGRDAGAFYQLSSKLHRVD
jgi:hypothetical protein